MTTYILSLTNIENGSFDYNVVEGVFLSIDEAKEIATSKVKAQASIWGVRPTIIKKVKGHLSQVEVKHPTLDITKVYSLQAVEARA